MNKTLFFSNLKRIIKTWLIFFLILLMYKTIIMGMYSPDDADALEAMLAMMPEGLITAMGFTITDTTFVGFMSGYYYGFIIIMFPMIYVILMSYNLVAKYVDNGSMGYLLSTPITRQEIIITQAATLIATLFDLLFAVTLAGILIAQLLYPGELAIGTYMLLNVGAFLLFLALSSITFFLSCLFSEGRYAFGFGIAIPVGFFVIRMLSDVDSRLDFLKFFTLFTLFDNNGIIAGNGAVYTKFIALLIIAAGFYTASVLVFKSKDLPL